MNANSRGVPLAGGGWQRLAGILTLDDLLELLAEEMSLLAKLLKHEQNRETKSRR